MSTRFTEAELEKAFISLIKKLGYKHVHGENIHKEVSEALLYPDLKQYLSDRYSKENITSGEIDSIIRLLDGYSRANLYDSNKIMKFLSSSEHRRLPYLALVQFSIAQKTINCSV